MLLLGLVQVGRLGSARDSSIPFLYYQRYQVGLGDLLVADGSPNAKCLFGRLDLRECIRSRPKRCVVAVSDVPFLLQLSKGLSYRPQSHNYSRVFTCERELPGILKAIRRCFHVAMIECAAQRCSKICSAPVGDRFASSVLCGRAVGLAAEDRHGMPRLCPLRIVPRFLLGLAAETEVRE